MARNKNDYIGLDPEKNIVVKYERVRIHFKSTCEVASAIRGMQYNKAIKYLNDVVKHKRAVPFRRFNGGIGRTAQAKEWKTSQAKWPVKSCSFLLRSLLSVKNNLSAKGISEENSRIQKIIVNRAPFYIRRNYRAHGRLQIIKYNPCHIQILIGEKGTQVPKANPKSVVKDSEAQNTAMITS